jgi:glycosyltransferase involved in cell wall biosynthesis
MRNESLSDYKAMTAGIETSKPGYPLPSYATEQVLELRILQVIPSISLTHGGPSHAIRSIESALSAVGLNVDTATTTDNGPDRVLVRSTGVRLDEEGAKRWYFAKRAEFYKFAPGFAFWLANQVREYDLVHIHALFSFTSTMAAWIARARGVPYVVRPLGVLGTYGMSRRRPWLKKLSFRLIEAPILKHAAAVHFTSTAELNETLLLGAPFRGVVIPLAVLTADEGRAQRALDRLTPPAVGLKLLFLSRLDPKKNIESLITALASMLASGLSITLMIAGRGRPDFTELLYDLACREGVSDHIRWLGQVEGQVKADLFAAADIFVLPSHSENFGIAVAEALMAGVPCVIGRGVALASQVQAAGAGLAVEPEPVAIRSAIESLMKDPQRRLEMALAARKLARTEFGPAAMAQRLTALYGEITGGKIIGLSEEE